MSGRARALLTRGTVYGLAALAAIIAVALVAIAPHLNSAHTSGGTQTSGDTSGSHVFAGVPGCGTTSATAARSTLLGATTSTPEALKTATAQFGPLPIIRVYYTGMPDPQAWTTGSPGLSHAAVVLSFRSPPATVLSGADDAALAHFFDAAPATHPIYFSYYHEPEPFIEHGDFTLAQYKSAWRRITAIAARAHNPCLVSTLILMGWDINPASGVNWQEYLPAGHVIQNLSWDAYPPGTVSDHDPQPKPPAQFMGPAVAASRSVGLPFGFAEFALGTATDRPQWLAQVAHYLRQTGAAYGTLFNSPHFSWMQLRDQASISAWRAAVAGSS